MGRRMAYRMMLYGQTTDLRYGHRKSANSCFIHIWGCRRCPYSKISLARAIARTIGCIVSSTSYLVNSYIPDIFDNQLLPYIINHKNRTGTSTEALLLICRSSVVSRRLASTWLQSYKLFLNNQRIVRKYLVISIIFRNFVPVPESTINTIYSPSKTHRSYEQDMENDSSSD